MPLYDLGVVAIQFAEAEHEKMTQQGGNIKVQIKPEFSQLGDNSILKFTDLAVNVVLKHIED